MSTTQARAVRPCLTTCQRRHFSAGMDFGAPLGQGGWLRGAGVDPVNAHMDTLNAATCQEAFLRVVIHPARLRQGDGRWGGHPPVTTTLSFLRAEGSNLKQAQPKDSNPRHRARRSRGNGAAAAADRARSPAHMVPQAPSQLPSQVRNQYHPKP